MWYSWIFLFGLLANCQTNAQFLERRDLKAQHAPLFTNQLTDVTHWLESWNDMETQTRPRKVCSLRPAQQVLHTRGGLQVCPGWKEA